MTPSQGEVWLVSLDPTIGDEIKKVRPCIVVSRDAIGVLALRVVAPVTAWQDRFVGCDWLVKLEPETGNGLDKVSACDTFQVRSLSIRRFVRKLGQLSHADQNRMAAGLRVVFNL
jgi:mRNA interferase MazF